MVTNTCHWCGGEFATSNATERTCNPYCQQMWRREVDRKRRAERRGEEYEVKRDNAGRVIRHCTRCSSRLSTWNRGAHCHSCWEKMSVKQRNNHGKKGDAYEPERSIRAERSELKAYGFYDDEGSDPATGIDGGAGRQDERS